MHSTQSYSVDVLIIGGGPAGSSTATMLSRKNLNTLLVEREQFPRFHIGESLLPNCNTFLKKLGVLEKIQNQNFVIKRGGQFMSPNKSHLVTNIFSEGLVKNMDMTYQVERSIFDKLLLDHAIESGTTVLQSTAVTDIKKTENGWLVSAANQGGKLQIACKWIVDASGRKCIVGRQLKLKREPLPIPGRLAIYNHFTQIPRESGERGGDTLVVRLEHAWVWIIPLSNGITSIGVVLQSGDNQMIASDKEATFWNKINESPVLVELTKNAVKTDDFKIDSDYSYAYEDYATQDAILVGDAASFIDPVFSSGVCIALESGILAAETIEKIAKNPKNQQKLFSKYTRTIKRNMTTMRKLIDMFYDMKGADLLLTPRPVLKIPQAVNAILAGILNPGWKIRWRLWIFNKIYNRHRQFPLVPPIQWEDYRTNRDGNN